jgi:hypothetical protein
MNVFMMRSRLRNQRAVLGIAFKLSILLNALLPIGGFLTIPVNSFRMKKPIPLLGPFGLRFAMVTAPLRDAIRGIASICSVIRR